MRVTVYGCNIIDSSFVLDKLSECKIRPSEWVERMILLRLKTLRYRRWKKARALAYYIPQIHNTYDNVIIFVYNTEWLSNGRIANNILWIESR